jgi:hypothetical protein
MTVNTNDEKYNILASLIDELDDAVSFMQTFESNPDFIGCVCETELEENCECVDENGEHKRIMDKLQALSEAERWLNEMKQELILIGNQENKLLSREDVATINFVVRLKKYTTFEFETKDSVYIDESQSEFSLFRLFIWEDGRTEILVANSEDYDIHEDASYLFDEEDIKGYFLESNVCDFTKEYIEHYTERTEVEDIDISDMIPA